MNHHVIRLIVSIALLWAGCTTQETRKDPIADAAVVENPHYLSKDTIKQGVRVNLKKDTFNRDGYVFIAEGCNSNQDDVFLISFNKLRFNGHDITFDGTFHVDAAGQANVPSVNYADISQSVPLSDYIPGGTLGGSLPDGRYDGEFYYTVVKSVNMKVKYFRQKFTLTISGGVFTVSGGPCSCGAAIENEK